MSRTILGILALAAAIFIAVAALYVMEPSPVHETRPPSLAALVPDPRPQPAPAASFVDSEGRQEALGHFKGRVVILNLWATWCAPCVRELPALGRLVSALGRGKVTVIAVNASHDTIAQSRAFLAAHGAGDLAVYRDPDLSLLTAFGAQGLPFSVLIDAKGREIARASGPIAWDDPAAVAYFKSLGEHAAS